jgi:flagellin
MTSITLSASVRQNLLALQDTAKLMETTQNRLATGKAVNSALDNPLNFFTSSNLNSRASDLNGLLDSMSNGIQTIQAANNGLTAVTSLVQQLKATVSQARADATAAAITPGNLTATANNSTVTNNKLTFDLGGGTAISVDTYNHTNATVSTTTSTVGTYNTDLSANGFTIDDGASGPVAISLQAGSVTLQDKIDDINADLAAANSTVVATADAGAIKLTNATGDTITVAEGAGTTAATLGFTDGQASTDGSVEVSVAKTLDELVTAINSNSYLSGKVKASIDSVSGDLSLDNLTTTAITLSGHDGTDVSGNAADSTTLAAGVGSALSSVRNSLLTQFNDLLGQIDKVAGDSGFSGVNLLNGDTLKLNFNENGTSSIDIQTKDANGAAFAIDSANLGIAAGTSGQFADNASLDLLTTDLSDALTTLRTQASALGSSLSVVQTRQDFTKSMINTLQTGADRLVLADSNQEGANLLALQTRQSLSTTALSLSAQADQAVLSLFQ